MTKRRPFIRNLLGILVVLASSTALAAPTGSIEGSLENLESGPFVVYVERVSGTSYPPLQPAPIMNQRGNAYSPHLLPIVMGSRVEFRTEDLELHNVHARNPSGNQTFFNIAMRPKGPSIFQTFSKEGVVRLTCNIHKEMEAFILVLQNPYFTVVEKGQRQFRIEGVPPGKYSIRIWGERLGEAETGRSFPVEVRADTRQPSTVNLQGGLTQ